jgi:integrase
MAQIIEVVKSKKYLVRVFTGRRNGKRTFYSKTITGTKKDAREFGREKERAHKLGLPLEPTNLTVDELLDRWLKQCQRHVRTNTHAWYCSLMDNYVRPHIGKCALAQLKPFDFEDLYAKLTEQGLSGRTVRHVHTRLGTAFKQAVKWEMLTKNPVTLAAPPPVEKNEMHFLSPDEAKRFVAATYEDPSGLILRFALATGLRPEEYIGLQWRELVLDNPKRGVAHVRRAVVWSKAGKGWSFGDVKSRASVRDVYFPLSLVRELQEHRRRQMEARLRMGKHYQNHDLVFAAPAGEPLHPDKVRRLQFRPALKRAELPATIRLYDLRHSYVTLSLVGGVKPKTVSEQAGHASVQFTLDNYAHVLPEEREGASDRLESLLFSASVTG